MTGGAGFIGTTLAGRLVGENEVIAVDNLHRDALSGTELETHPNFHFVEGDVLDLAQLTELTAGCTHVVHAAGIAGVDTVVANPVLTMRVNVIGTYNALEAALATRDTVERLVEFSTSEVFGQHAFNVQEAHVTTIGSVGEARWTYAVSKLAGEHMSHAYHSELGLPTVSVRPFNIYGPGQIGGGAIRAFIEAALGGRDLEIHGDGSQIRAWCYVDDMVEAILLVARAPGRRRRELQRRERPLGRHDLRPRDADQAADRLSRRDPLRAARLHGRRAPDPQRREGAGAARLRGAGRAGRRPRAHDRVVSRQARRSGVTEPDLRLARPDVGEDELAAVAAVLESGQLTMGPKVAAFERAIADAVGTADAVAVSTGTAALHLAVLALGIGPGDEVIVPAYTFPATANAVELCGARAVLVDVDPETFLVRPSSSPTRSRRGRARSSPCTCSAGRSRGRSSRPQCRRKSPLVEDAAGALGARYRGTPCGALGLMGCLSFHPRKIVTTGEGGAVTTDEAELAAAVRRLRHHGIAAGSPVDIPAPGFNYRLPDVLCALGIPQLARLESLLHATRASRRLVLRAPRPPRRDAHQRTRATGTAGRRTSSRSTAGTRRWRACARRESRPRSERTRSTGCPHTATAARSPARTRPSSEHWRCRSRRRCPRTTSTGCARLSRASPRRAGRNGPRLHSACFAKPS